MRKTALACYVGIFIVLALVSCGYTQPPTGGRHKVPLPTGTPRQIVGAPAITPTLSGIPAFAKDDVMAYVTTHNMPFDDAPPSDITAVEVSFITSREVNALIDRQNTSIPDSYLLCFVRLTGRFVFAGPPTASGQATSLTYQHAYQVFDAKTGNLLMGGGLEEATIPVS